MSSSKPLDEELQKLFTFPMNFVRIVVYGNCVRIFILCTYSRILDPAAAVAAAALRLVFVRHKIFKKVIELQSSVFSYFFFLERFSFGLAHSFCKVLKILYWWQ